MTSRTTLPRLLAALLLTSLVWAGAAPAASAAPLATRIAREVQASPVRGTTSVIAWDQQTREVIYTRNADRPVTPASTMKLLTSAAVLAHFGGDHRFETSIWTTGTIDPADPTRWLGSLYVVGGGDPSLSTAGFARDNYGSVTSGTNIAGLIAPLQKLGVTTVAGRIFVVDDYLDSERYVREWPSHFRFEETGALGALTVNQSQVGRWIGSGSTRTPDVRAGAILHGLFERAGIEVIGAPRAGSLPTFAVEAGTIESPPLRVLLRHLNRSSDNFYAEMLLKDLGRSVYGPGKGTTADGRRAGRVVLDDLGVDVTRLTWVDGSGLAYGNRVTGRLLSHVLGIGAQASWSSEWIDSLSRSGVAGTIRRRMSTWPYRNRISAKTGTLRHVSALAGFSTRLGGTNRYGFVVVTSNPIGSQVSYTAARRLQDRVAMTLVR
ncbi:MAG: D-alanyl-D-alaninecarboxypeptidase/D-alanyl-D-alanine-endopeptidase [Thermoleophilia bacterium]|nr:D-alanyl-D-alaninecarboxypeptidase/D-alanyl-D-alanine-endopeptidase [Thermoleophilia bacterium]